jgi:hypothetical protein
VKLILAVAVAAACVVAATLRSAWRRHCRVVARFEQGNPDRIDRTGAAMGVVAPGSVPPGAWCS